MENTQPLFEIRTDLAAISKKDWARKHGALKADGSIDVVKFATLPERPGQPYKFPTPIRQWTPSEMAGALAAFKAACLTRADEIEAALVKKYPKCVPTVKFGEMFSDTNFATKGVNGVLSAYRSYVTGVLKEYHKIPSTNGSTQGVKLEEGI